MPEITKFYTNGALSFAEIGASDKVPLKKIVQLFGEGVCITVKTDTGHKLLTPYLLTALENSEAFGITIMGENRVIISLVAPEKEGAQHV